MFQAVTKGISPKADSVRIIPSKIKTHLKFSKSLVVGHVYEFALKGFSVRMSAQVAAALSADPDVAYVEQDSYMHAIAAVTPTGVSVVCQP